MPINPILSTEIDTATNLGNTSPSASFPEAEKSPDTKSHTIYQRLGCGPRPIARVEGAFLMWYEGIGSGIVTSAYAVDENGGVEASRGASLEEIYF